MRPVNAPLESVRGLCGHAKRLRGPSQVNPLKAGTLNEHGVGSLVDHSLVEEDARLLLVRGEDEVDVAVVVEGRPRDRLRRPEPAWVVGSRDAAHPRQSHLDDFPAAPKQFEPGLQGWSPDC